MKIYFNDKEINIFNGARVEDVLRKYSLDEYKEVKAGNKIVIDKYNNQVMLGGELRDGEELFLKSTKKSN